MNEDLITICQLAPFLAKNLNKVYTPITIAIKIHKEQTTIQTQFSMSPHLANLNLVVLPSDQCIRLVTSDMHVFNMSCWVGSLDSIHIYCHAYFTLPHIFNEAIIFFVIKSIEISHHAAGNKTTQGVKLKPSLHRSETVQE